MIIGIVAVDRQGAIGKGGNLALLCGHEVFQGDNNGPLLCDGIQDVADPEAAAA